ncbi:integrase [Bradyrhizobium japonicum]|jgi:integrase|uniref:tyrosine-type recombinase/integrase n=1 Tax=Bradyrhizobium TaxID=374 RepID=UPI00041AF9FF|nr:MULTISPECIES: integrase arm-type DNA-binding domain-containing protein [Bradyrhizobium]MBR0876630.1 integrase arm-type DNA-binding domain-containing protein [Bradyrhizobium liaoningense]MBR1002773.1 integrase arm-type DNA-binding domain-containing protein [Bradyrhizobium liaoningense]MBR1062826.1 integrase arm-type DNA-binding domain-containing protein [Bradyrhizobium liaoningense]MCP1744350.1 integrase [Bradyrhizobium japonicum]MCP1782631.1 integrase [Bradyrhizobium japonicum]
MKTITTDVQVRNLKPAAEDYRRTVGGNLYLLIKANGSKLWRYDYKVGTRKTLAIGAYPEVSLSDAMTARDNAARLVKRGIDPKDHRDQERRAEAERKAAESPFGADADGWLKTREGSAKKTYLRDELMVRYLKEGADSIPGFGAVNTNQVALSHILPLLNHFNHETRRRLLSTARNVISFARVHNHFPQDRQSPFAEIKLGDGFAPHQTKNRPAIIQPDDFGDLIRQIDDFGTIIPSMSARRRKLIRYALQLLALTFVRPGTIETAEWDHFHFGKDHSVWIVPFAKLKMRTERAKKGNRNDFLVPLSRQAVALLRELRTITGSSRYLFPGADRKATAKKAASSGMIAEGSLNDALHLLGYKGKHCAHGVRSSASTMLNRERINGRRRFEQALVEMQQDRLDASTRAIYDRDDRLPERIELMQFWADMVDTLRATGAPKLRVAA